MVWLLLFLPLFNLFCHESCAVVTENDPATLVEGVSVITGDFYLAEDDYTVAGAEPIPVLRLYLSSHDGIDQYPHTHAKFYLHRDEIVVSDPNGTEITYVADRSNKRGENIGSDFYYKKCRMLRYNSADFTKNTLGITNTSTGTLSAKTQLKNQTIVFNADYDGKGKSFVLYAADGTHRRYGAHSHQGKGVTPYLYKLESERLPNGRVLHYVYNDKNHAVAIRALNPQSTKTLAWLFIPNFDLKRELSYCLRGSDGRSLSSVFRSIGKDPSGNNLFELSQKISPERAAQAFSYSKNLITRISLPLSRTVEIQYDGAKVARLLSPLGPNGSLIPYYSFQYRDHSSECTDALGNKTQYFWNHDYRLTQIKRFDKETTPKNKETFVWEGTNLKAKVFYDEADRPIFAKTLLYDERGNVLEEVLWGSLSGRGPPLHIGSNGLPLDDGVEKMIARNSYDNRDLPVRSIQPSGLVTETTYISHAQLPSSKTLSEQGRLLSKTTYTYNADNTLIREETEDGAFVHTIREIIPREEDPYIALPDWILEKYREHGQEKLLLKAKFHYTNGALVSQKDIYDALDAHRYSLYYKYDAKGRLLEETNALGQTAFYAYDEVGNITYSKNFGGRLETFFTYDLANRLIEKREKGTDGIEQIYRYSYDHKHNLTAETDPYGNTTQYEYDSEGRRTKTIYPSQRTYGGGSLQPTTTTTYNALGAPIAQADALGNITRTETNSLGKPIRIIHPDGAVEQNIYALDGTLALSIDPNGTETHYRYDALGHLIEKKTEEATETYTYSGNLLIQKVDAEGSITTYTYDGAGRKVSETLDGETLRFTYDPLGRIASQIAGESITTYTYDLLGRLLEEKQTDASNNIFHITQYEYDTSGNQTAITTGYESTERSEHDSLNRLIQKKDPLGATTRVHYTTAANDLGQNVLQKTTIDPLGLETIEILNARAKPQHLEKRKDRALLVEELYYDANGQKVAQSLQAYQPDGTSRTLLNQWEYDARQRLKTLREGNNEKITHYEYDPTGRKTLEIKPDGTRLFFVYNRLGYLTRLYSSDRTVDHTLTPDKLGRPISFDGIKRTLDGHGRILQETLHGHTVENTYDAQGRRIRFSVPTFNIHIDYHFGPHCLKKVQFQDKTHEYTRYDLAGNLLEETLIDGQTLHRTYDQALRPLSIQANTFTQRISKYDPLGNILSMETNGKPSAYTYDELYQLTSELGEFCHTYQFDPLCNRLSKDTETYTLNSLNQIPSHCLYDPNGNPIQIGDLRLTYDALNRLTSVETPKQTIHYTYDYLNRTLTRTQSGETDHFLYDGQNEIGSYNKNLQDFRVLGQTETAEIGAAIALIIGEIHTPIHDLQGNLAALGPQEQYRYTAFGEEALSTEPLSPWRFSSKRVDPATGYVNYGRRYYIPTLGRWLTPDPLGLTAGHNLYAFVHNDPLTHLDEYGLLPLPISYSPRWKEPPESLGRFGTAAVHEIGHQTSNLGRAVASTPYQVERGYNYLSGREKYSFADWNAKQNQFFDRAEDWMYKALPTDRNHPDYLMYRRGIGLTIDAWGYTAGGYGLLKGGMKVAQLGVNAWKIKKGAFVAGEKLASASRFAGNRGAENINAAISLKTKLKQLETIQQTAVKKRVLPDGRIRYYKAERMATYPGPTRGSAYVTEYNTTTGQIRGWNECYDQLGNVNRVHPKDINGQNIYSHHYPLISNEIIK